MALELLANRGVVLCVKVPPSAVSEFGCDLARMSDVGEQQSGQSTMVTAPEHHRCSVRRSGPALNLGDAVRRSQSAAAMAGVKNRGLLRVGARRRNCAL